MIELESRLLDLIDSNIADASDDELFVGGYLRGHITLAVVDAEQQGLHDANSLYQQVNASLQIAIKSGELSPADQVVVRKWWEIWFKQAVG